VEHIEAAEHRAENGVDGRVAPPDR